MLIKVNELKGLYKQFEQFNDKLLEMKLASIENAIRAHTNNNFINRQIQATCLSRKNQYLIEKGSTLFRVGDTVNVSYGVNQGVYTVQEIDGNVITLDRMLYDGFKDVVSKVDYPFEVVEGATKILEWDMFDRKNMGKASETISRHSVTYQQYDGTNTISGYPSVLFGFCKPYMRCKT